MGWAARRYSGFFRPEESPIQDGASLMKAFLGRNVGWPKLEWFCLDHGHVTVDAMRHFITLHLQLETLNLLYCNITTAHIEAAATASTGSLRDIRIFGYPSEATIQASSLVRYYTLPPPPLITMCQIEHRNARIGGPVTWKDMESGYVSEHPSYSWENWSRPITAGGHAIEVRPLMATFYSGAEVNKMFWTWGRSLSSGSIYYWSLGAGVKSGHGTVAWKCTRGSTGKTIICVDPFDHWQDWGKVTGDVAEPTPLDKEFVEFVIFKREPTHPLPSSTAVIPAHATKMTEDMRKEYRKQGE